MLRKPEDFYAEGSKVFQKAATNRVTVDGWITISKGKVADAQRAANSPTTRIGAAYDAILNLSLAMVLKNGWRVTSGEGHHQQTLEAACAYVALTQRDCDAVDAIRNLRNDQYRAVEPSAGDIEYALGVLEKVLPPLLEHLDAGKLRL